MREFEGIAVPMRWPSAWPHLWHAVRDRAVFVAAVAVLTLVGLAVVGDPPAQWWVPAVPLVLLTGPALRPVRVRTALQRSAVRGWLAVVPGLIQADPAAVRTPRVLLVTDYGQPVTVPVAAAVARALALRHGGQPALLVWTTRTASVWGAAALVLADARVAYLRAVPAGVRAVDLRLRPAAGVAVLVQP